MGKKVSIILPCKEIDAYTKECIRRCLSLGYLNREILVLPDKKPKESFSQIKIIPTGSVKPAKKRDLAGFFAKGEILAFIDNDAYPAKNWLSRAVKHFEKKEIAAVGGPAVTPKCDSLMQKAGGSVLASFLGGGPHRFRYIPTKQREVDDYPTCNFIIKKSIFKKLGGFDTRFWPGEDTKLCLQITNHLKKKIIYDPKVLVYHHRRKLFIPHLKQIWSYALHRGYFAKKLPQTSFRLSYFIPSMFFLFILFAFPLSFFNPAIKHFFITGASIYLILAFAASLQASPGKSPVALVVLGIFLTHLVYGAGFIKGLMIRRLKI